jgi:hypothetical protein
MVHAGRRLMLPLLWLSVWASAGAIEPLPAAPLPGKDTASAPGAGQAAPAPDKPRPEVTAPERISILDRVKHPLPYLTWGGDIRIRQEYENNIRDFNRDQLDHRNVIRTRYRLWAEMGRFFSDPALRVPNGLSFYGRLLYEPRYYSQYQPSPAPPYPDWNEVAVDNLYMDWQRIGGLPISWRLGRQDIRYGRSFIFGSGTPLDGSRSAYFDASKATIHLDPIQSQVDFLCIRNRGDESDRLKPWNWEDVQSPVSEYDVDAHGVYFTTKIVKDHEIGVYYLSKHDDPLPAYVDKHFSTNTIRTAGAILQGKTGRWDYYAEGAGQTGTYGDQRQRAYAFSGDMGYTFRDTAWTPRIHGGYEYLSGDDPNTKIHEGWDPVFSREPRWSDVLYSHFSKEYGKSGYWTNLQRLTLGVGAKPLPGLTLLLDTSLVLANEHDNGTDAPFGRGLTRGMLCSPKAIWDIDQYVKMDKNLKTRMHLWCDYFRPGSFYAPGADPAVFLRWQIEITF